MVHPSNWYTILTVLEILGSGVVAAGLNAILIFWLKERLKQSIQHEYNTDLEALKTELQLDLDRKKRLYEGKLTQYKKYLNVIDTYSQSTRRKLFSNVNEGLLSIIDDPSDENSLKYFQGIMKMQESAADAFLTFKNELNGLRLEAGGTLLDLIDECVKVLEHANDKTTDYLNTVNQNAGRIYNEPGLLQQLVDEYTNSLSTTEIRSFEDVQIDIFREMRRELRIDE